MITSVADKHKTAGLAGVVAGQTAISTVGKEGLGLTYRGYAIEDLARDASFEEVAHLLIHEELPTPSQAGEYQCRLMGLRELPDAVAGDPGADSRLGPSDGRAPHGLLGAGLPGAGASAGRSGEDRRPAAGDVALDAAGLVPLQPSPKSESISAPTQPSLAGHFLQLLHGKPPDDRAAPGAERFADSVCGARVQRLDLRRPDRRLDAVRLLLGRHGGDRHAAGPACTAGPTRRRST